MGDKKRKNKKQRRKNVEGSSKRGKLPSSVQALLGYLGGGGPTPMYQQPVNVQRERAGVDSIETLSQIIRQQNLMNASYMQNMERLAFKNEIQDQLKKQGEEQKKEIKEAREEQKQEISKVVVQTQEAIQETTEKSLQQQRTSLMRKIAYERKKVNSKPEKIQSLEDQLEVIESSIRNSKVSELRSSLRQTDPNLVKRVDMPSTPYVPPIGTNNMSIASWLDSTPPSISTSSFQNMPGSLRATPVLERTPLFQVAEAEVGQMAQMLPALDKNRNESFYIQSQLSGQVDEAFRILQSHIKKANTGREKLQAQQELRRNLALFTSTDANFSSGNFKKENL
jgi:hypothetical protein